MNMEEMRERMEILEALSVLNRDDGAKFTDASRLDAIAELLWNSRYRRINPQGLFHLYATTPIAAYRDRPVIVLSSHVDCVRSIYRCFTSEPGGGMLLGTYDNSITNAAALSRMLRGALPDDALVAFTGDEEENCAGAKQLATYLRESGARIACVIVLDVTDMGWADGAAFTLENNFWNDALGRAAVESAERIARESGVVWRFVPSDPERIPPYVPEDCAVHEEAEPDESWEYDELDVPCFSFCLPVKGEMHSNAGCRAREASYHAYARALSALTEALSAALRKSGGRWDVNGER